jgi:hypothetical protein
LAAGSSQAAATGLLRSGQYVAPPPAPQEVCYINAFDPAWGAPPDKVRGVPLRFNPDLGAYEFDAGYAQRNANLDGYPIAAESFRVLFDQWNGGSMLQPYKVAGSSTWRYRWIPRARVVHCGEPPTIPTLGRFDDSSSAGSLALDGLSDSQTTLKSY